MWNEITYNSLKSKSFTIPAKRMEQFKLLSVSFLQDWDLVQSGVNESIAFAEDGDSAPRIAKIPVGTYSIADFPTAIANSLSASGSQVYNAVYNGTTRKLTISTTGSKTFKILSGSRGSSAFRLAGISRWSDTDMSSSFTLKNPVNLSGSYPVLLTSNINIAGVRYLSDYNDSASSVLTSIMPDSFGDVITWTNDSGNYLRVDETISKIEFHLIDSLSGNEILSNAPLVVRFTFSDDPLDI